MGLTPIRSAPTTGSASSACCRAPSSTCWRGAGWLPSPAQATSSPRPAGRPDPARPDALADACLAAPSRPLPVAPPTASLRFDYNLLVIGAGAGGLVTSYIAAAVKARVALIEQHRMGDCLHTGCVPQGADPAPASPFEQRKATELGLPRARLRRLRRRDGAGRQVIEEVEPHDSVARYEGTRGGVHQGGARVTSPGRWRSTASA